MDQILRGDLEKIVAKVQKRGLIAGVNGADGITVTITAGTTPKAIADGLIFLLNECKIARKLKFVEVTQVGYLQYRFLLSP